MVFYTDYKFYIIIILLSILLLFTYLIIYEGIKSGWISSIYTARWIPDITYVYILYAIAILLIGYVLYTLYNDNNNEYDIYGLLLLLVFMSLLQIFSLYAFRHITASLLLSTLNMIVVFWILYRLMGKDMALYILFISIIYLYILFMNFNIYCRNVLNKLPYNEASSPELLHYKKLYEKHCIECHPYVIYKPYCNLYGNN